METYYNSNANYYYCCSYGYTVACNFYKSITADVNIFKFKSVIDCAMVCTLAARVWPRKAFA